MSEHSQTLAHARATLAEVRYRTDIHAGHHDLVADESVPAGGADAGPNPFALVLSGLGACTAITLRMYAERKGWALRALSVEMTCFREDKAVKVERVLIIEGLDAEQNARMADIAERTPVTLALKGGMAISTRLA